MKTRHSVISLAIGVALATLSLTAGVNGYWLLAFSGALIILFVALDALAKFVIRVTGL